MLFAVKLMLLVGYIWIELIAEVDNHIPVAIPAVPEPLKSGPYMERDVLYLLVFE